MPDTVLNSRSDKTYRYTRIGRKPAPGENVSRCGTPEGFGLPKSRKATGLERGQPRLELAKRALARLTPKALRLMAENADPPGTETTEYRYDPEGNLVLQLVTRQA